MKNNQNLLKWIFLVVLAFIWGSSFILMYRGMFTQDGIEVFNSNQVAAIRMSLAGLVLLPFALKNIKTINKKTIGPLLISGFFGNFFPAFLFTFAETELDSSFVGMLNSSVPIITIIIGFIVFKVKISNQQIIGLCIGVAGIIGLVLSKGNVTIGGEWYYILAVIGATTCYAISLNTIKHRMEGLNAIQITSLSFFLTLIPSLILSYITIDTSIWTSNHTESFVYIAILAVIGTAFAVLIYSKLITISSALFASSVTYLIPIVATFWGIFNHENIGLLQVLFMVVLLIGVLTINLNFKKIVGIK